MICSLSAQGKVKKQGRTNAFIPIEADTLGLPFADNTFDIVSVGFGIRNVADLRLGIREMCRVAVANGRIAILEFTQADDTPIFAIYTTSTLGGFCRASEI